MRLSNLFNIFTGGMTSDENSGLEANSETMVLLMAHDQNEPVYIAGTASELYDSHNFNDLGIWYDGVDDEME